MTDPTLPARLVLIDDHPLVREALRQRLDGNPRIQIVGEAGDATQALALIERETPDLALVDIGLEGMNGVELSRLLHARFPATAVLILSAHKDQHYVSQSVEAGARGYVLKNSSTAQIVSAIEAVVAGGSYFSNDVVPVPGQRSALDVLSERERCVLNHIVEGRSNKEIARLLDLSVRTVETHRLTIKRKLDIDSSAGLVKWALKNGLTKL